MSSILPFLANCQDVPRHLQDTFSRVIPTQPQSSQYSQINLFCPCQSSQQLPKSKWALVFQTERELAAFIAELDRNEEKQSRLSIVDYSVFANVMFVFMNRQYKICVWVQHIKDMIVSQPLGVFIFQERFRQLVELVEKNTAVYYNIEWGVELLPRKYMRKLGPEESQYQAELSEDSEGQRRYRASQYGMMGRRQINRFDQVQRSNSLNLSDDENQRFTRYNTPLGYSSYSQRVGEQIRQSQYSQKAEDQIQNFFENNQRVHSQFLKFQSNTDITEELRDFSIKMLEKINELNTFFSNFIGLISNLQKQPSLKNPLDFEVQASDD